MRDSSRPNLCPRARQILGVALASALLLFGAWDASAQSETSIAAPSPALGAGVDVSAFEAEGYRVEYLTLDELYERLEALPQWQERVRAESSIFDARVRGARTLEDPSLSYEVAGHVHGSDFSDGSQHAVTIEWEAPLRRVRQGRAQVVERELEVLRAELNDEFEGLRQAIREAWASASTRASELLLFGEVLHDLDALRVILSERVAQGVTPRYELERLDLWILQLRNERSHVEDDLILEGLWLGGLIDDPSLLALPEDAWQVPERDYRALIDDSELDPEVAIARAQSAAAIEEARLARRERTPTLVVSGGPMFATNDYGVAAVGGVSMRVPVSGRGRYAVREADATARAAEAQRAWTEHLNALNQARALRKWEQTLAALHRFDEEIGAQLDTTLALAQASYLAETIGFAELLESVASKLELARHRLHLIQELAEQEVTLLRWVE